MEEEEVKRPKDGLLVMNMGALKIALKKSSPIIVIVTIVMFLVGTVLSKGKIDITWTASGKLVYYKDESNADKLIPFLLSKDIKPTTLKKLFRLDHTQKIFYNKMKKKFGKELISPGIHSSVMVDKESGFNVFIVSFTHKDKEIAFQGAKLAMETVKEAFFIFKEEAARKLLKRKKNKLTLLKKAYETSVWEMDEFNDKLGVISFPDTFTQVKSRLLDIDKQLFTTKIAISEHKINIDLLEKKLSIPYKYGKKFNMSSFKKELYLKQIEYEKLSLKYTKNHPKLKLLEKEIESLKEFQNETTLKLSDTIDPNKMVASLYDKKTNLVLNLNTLYEKQKNYQALKDRYEEKKLHFLTFKKEYENLDALIIKNLEKWRIARTNVHKLTDLLESIEENIQTYKPAEMPTVPHKKTRKILIVILSVVGLIVSTLIVIIRELFDMRIRYRFDLENRYGLEYLGTVPNIDDVKQIEFDSAMLELTTTFDNFMLKFEKPINLFISSDISQSGKSFVLARLEQLLIANDYKILYIESTKNSGIDIDDKFVNQFLFNHNIPINLKISSLHPNIDKCYFNLNDKIKFKIPNKKAIAKFYAHLKMLKYDFIFIESFPFELNKHIYLSFANSCDATILISKHFQSSRKRFTDIVEALDEKGIEHILGIRNDVDKKHITV